MKKFATVTVEIEITYVNNVKMIHQNVSDKIVQKHTMDNYVSHALFDIRKDKIKDTFIEKEILRTNGDDYVKFSLESKGNFLSIETLIDCFELINDKDYEIVLNKNNIISYLYAFSITQLNNKKEELLNQFKNEIYDSNIIPFISAVSALKIEKFYSFIFFLVMHIINRINGLDAITCDKVNYDNIIKFSSSGSYSSFSFDKNRIKYNTNLSANLKFLQSYYESTILQRKNKFYEINNYFNIGKVYRRKNNEGLLSDYPHFYQLSLENDTDINFFAMRESENSNFLISMSIDDFTRHSPNYLGEIEANFWGTQFTIFDCGLPQSIYDKSPSIYPIRKNMGTISYETNIMGDFPRLFKIDVNTMKEEGIIHLENLKPEWSERMECYCLNFYGRVKKASAKNFQIIIPGDTDNIILQHGKVNKNEFNIDFREPFCPLFAFAVSLVAIGKKRVVS